MNSQPIDFGIVSYGYAFGDDCDVVAEAVEEFVDDPERVYRWGYKRFHRAPEGMTGTQLAARAARMALDRAGLTPDDVDQLILAVSDVPDYLNWDASAALARELKIHLKPTLLLSEGCVSGVTGFGNAAGLFAVHPELTNVLFVAVNRVSEYHRNRMKVNNSIHSDGASAVVLRRGHDAGRWLATEQFTDPEVADWFRTDYGGSVAPVAPDGWTVRDHTNGLERVQDHFRDNPAGLRDFVQALNSRLVEVVDRACDRAGVKRENIAKVVHLNDNQGSFEEIAEEFAIPVDRTNAAMAALHGHMGAADHVATVAMMTETGELVPGDVVAMIGISIGMRWYCTLVRI